MSLFSVDDLTVRFGTTIGVRSVSLEAEPGRITGILGANGAGKTTTLLGIHARMPRVSGRIVLDGRDLSNLNTAQLVRAGIALCPENRRLFPNMTIEDNLLLGVFGHPRKLVTDATRRLCRAIREKKSEDTWKRWKGQMPVIYNNASS